MTKKQFEQHFREEVLPSFFAREQEVGFPDKPGRRTAWNNLVDSYMRDGMLPPSAGDWGHPRWLETYQPRGRQHSTMRASASGDWWSAGQRWLEQQALKESAAQKAAWVKSGRSPNTFRYNPPQWHRDAVAALGRNDEETFKAIKLDQLGTRGLPPLRGAPRHHSTVKSPSQLDREIAEATGIGTWKKSDRPYMSEHLDIGHASARVKPTALHSSYGTDYEWTIWIGPKERRVLHQSGETRTKAAAKRAAERKLAALR